MSIKRRYPFALPASIRDGARAGGGWLRLTVSEPGCLLADARGPRPAGMEPLHGPG